MCICRSTTPIVCSQDHHSHAGNCHQCLAIRTTINTLQCELLGTEERHVHKSIDVSRKAAMQGLRQVMMRMQKGAVGMRVGVWLEAVKCAARESENTRHHEMQAGLKTQMREAGVRQMRQVMARMVKGELGLRVEMWHSEMTHEVNKLSQQKQLDETEHELEMMRAWMSLELKEPNPKTLQRP